MSHDAPNPNKSVNLTIDGKPVTVPEGTTILEAARKINVKIPTLCDHPSLGKRAVCRLCVVECDGRGKLVAACANEVWEGVNVVTNNLRLLNIRKTIVAMLLANHPQECLGCIRSGKCDLQSLARVYGKDSSGDRKELFPRMIPEGCVPEKSGRTLVRNMDKCVKCGRCIEVCQELQTVRSINSGHRSVEYEICTPYREALGRGSCIYCGQCARVCPVGAIYECEHNEEAWTALNKDEQTLVTQISAPVAAALEKELGLAPGTITLGRMVSALKQLGFDKVFCSDDSVNMCIKDEAKEFLDRLDTKNNLPMLISCSPALNNFIDNFYPDLKAHLPGCHGPEQSFGALVKDWYQKKKGIDPSKIAYVSIMPCIAKKYETRRSEQGPNSAAGVSQNVDLALTVKELAPLIRIAGISFSILPESPFDSFAHGSDTAGAQNANPKNPGLPDIESVLARVYEAYTDKILGAFDHKELKEGSRESLITIQGKTIRVLTVIDFANARTVMDSIRKSECDAALVHIISCPLGCGSLDP